MPISWLHVEIVESELSVLQLDTLVNIQQACDAPAYSSSTGPMWLSESKNKRGLFSNLKTNNLVILENVALFRCTMLFLLKSPC